MRSEMNKPINVKRSARRAAKHTHRHRTPPPWDGVYLDFKGVGRSIIQSIIQDRLPAILLCLVDNRATILKISFYVIEDASLEDLFCF